MRFRSKVVEIDAWQFNGYDGAPDWIGDLFDETNTVVASGDGEALYIATLEGLMTASRGDWIIKGLIGELYPCKPAVFAAKYEPVNDLPSRRSVRRWLSGSRSNVEALAVTEFIFDLDKLDQMRERAALAVEFLRDFQDDRGDAFKSEEDARHALALYRETLRRAAPELIRLARMGAQAEARSKQDQPDLSADTDRKTD